MSLTKFERKKFILMDVDKDFDFDIEKQMKEWKTKNSILEKMYNGFLFESPSNGQIVHATFVGQSSDFLLFDGNFKDYIRVENRNNESRYLKNTNVGDKVDVLVVEIDDKDFMIKGSLSSLYESRAHETLKAIDEDQSVTIFVRELTPAGYNVDVLYEGVTLSGFMPNTLAGINKLYDVESILGKQLEVMVESYSKDEGTYIVSRRKYLQSLIPEAIKELKRGEVYDGNVTGTTPFGVFVEFGECLTGMIHKTNINPDWQDRISEIQPGFPIQFYVKEIVKDKIILTQILRESLWDSVKNGQVLTGKVKENKQFGSLVYLDQETIGLIHISELEKSGKTISAGEEIKVKVIAVDRHNRKIFLSVN
jgi:small subunit ribosomal protein S1